MFLKTCSFNTNVKLPNINWIWYDCMYDWNKMTISWFKNKDENSSQDFEMNPSLTSTKNKNEKFYLA